MARGKFIKQNQPLEEVVLPCKDKLAFDTKREANGTANVVDYRYGSAVHAYRCRHCGLWHLASGRD